MVGEVTAKVVGEVAKETAKETAKEVGKQAGKQAVDITKRIDVSAKAADSKASGVDITKRITPEKSANTERIGKELSQVPFIFPLPTPNPYPCTLRFHPPLTKCL